MFNTHCSLDTAETNKFDTGIAIMTDNQWIKKQMKCCNEYFVTLLKANAIIKKIDNYRKHQYILYPKKNIKLSSKI